MISRKIWKKNDLYLIKFEESNPKISSIQKFNSATRVFGNPIENDKTIFKFFEKYESDIFCGKVPVGCQEG